MIYIPPKQWTLSVWQMEGRPWRDCWPCRNTDGKEKEDKWRCVERRKEKSQEEGWGRFHWGAWSSGYFPIALCLCPLDMIAQHSGAHCHRQGFPHLNQCWHRDGAKWGVELARWGPLPSLEPAAFIFNDILHQAS